MYAPRSPPPGGRNRGCARGRGEKTLGAYAPDNLVHIVLDNEAHDSTGAQATVTPSIDFARIAQACGYGLSVTGGDLEVLDIAISADEPGAKFAHLKIQTGTMANLPRPGITPTEVVRRLMQHIGTHF